MNTEQLRNQLKRQRSQQTKQQQSQRSKQIANNLSQSSVYSTAKHVALYLPVNGEADPRSLVSGNTDPERKFYLPVLSPTGNKQLLFHQWDKNTQFTNNIYGIPEPITSNSSFPATQLDLVIMPLLGFDTQGNRLGMGGGYYDRTFAFKLADKAINKPLLVAYAYAFQECNKLYAQSWDVPFDYYSTENEFAKI